MIQKFALSSFHLTLVYNLAGQWNIVSADLMKPPSLSLFVVSSNNMVQFVTTHILFEMVIAKFKEILTESEWRKECLMHCCS